MADKYIETDIILDENDYPIDKKDVNTDLGYLVSENKLVAHFDGHPEIERKWHYIVKRFYFMDGTEYEVESQDDPHVIVIDDGVLGIFEWNDLGMGKEVKGIDLEEHEDVPYEPAEEPYDEYEVIQRYILYTPEELAQRKKQKEQAEMLENFMTTGPKRLENTEDGLEDLTLLMAEMIGV